MGEFRDQRSYLAPNPVTGTTSQGGLLDTQAVDLGNGMGAMLVLQGTRNATSVAPSTTTVQLLAANIRRVSASVQNNDTTKNMYLGYGAAATVGPNVIPPGGVLAVPTKYIGGVINAIWDAGATVNAAILETTA